ncbi:MAG TPA: hypothetical protein VFV15_05705 [Moraxellaceae bacterium]|nr:hypothetical protein [Moraxellaceae bacterium]
MRRSGRWGVVVVLAALAAGWHYRDRLQALAGVAPGGTAAQAARPVPQDAPDVLYTWVDDKGVTHFEQRPGKGKPVAYDGSRITPLAPADPAQAERLRQAAEGMPAATSSTAPASPAGTLHRLREELATKARALREQRAAQRDF